MDPELEVIFRADVVEGKKRKGEKRTQDLVKRGGIRCCRTMTKKRRSPRLIMLRVGMRVRVERSSRGI